MTAKSSLPVLPVVGGRVVSEFNNSTATAAATNNVTIGLEMNSPLHAHQAAQSQPSFGVPAPAAEAARDIESGSVLQLSDSSLPSDIRLGFVKKVYALVALMLVVSFGIASPFVFLADDTSAWLDSHKWLTTLMTVVFITMILLNMCLLCSSRTASCYMKMFKTVPWNYMYLFTFASIFGFWLGIACARYTAGSVCLVFAISFILVVALTAYAICTKADFSGMGAYALVLLLGLLMSLLVSLFFPSGSYVHRIIGGVGATIFGFIIVYDTQLIFGSSSFGGKRNFEYTVDMYAFAAFNLYLDFINFFLYMLKFMGQRK